MFRTPKEQNSRDRNDFLPSLPSELLVLVRKGTCGSCARRLGSGRAPRGWLRAGPDCLNKGACPFLRSIRSIPEGWAGLASQMMTLGVETHSLCSFPSRRGSLALAQALRGTMPLLFVLLHPPCCLLLLSLWPSLPLAPFAGFIPPRLPVTLSSLSSLPIPQMTFFRALFKSRAAWQGLSSSSFLLSHQKRHLI